MFKIFVVLALFGCAFAGTIPKDPNSFADTLDGRIVGGEETTIDKFPYQVSLLRNGGHTCGGSIYNEEIIVTAAHCLQNDVKPSDLRIRAGSSYSNEGGVIARVASFKNHEYYSTSPTSNDIAVIKLASPLPMSSKIEAIPLSKTSPDTGEEGVVSGWGVTSSGGTTASRVLRYVDLTILSREVCKSSDYGYGSSIRPGTICAYAENKDTCQGDSGGPLVSDGILVGVVSWGKECAREGFPGVYTDVAKFHNWIVDTANELSN